MRIILKIAGAELRTLFYSPIAWVIAITFFVACGINFVNPLEAVATNQQFNLDNNPAWNGFNFSLSHNLFSPSYKFLFDNLFLFIPLLTMGTISREVQAGTISLLNSSPVKTRAVVLGKYLGLILYNALLMIPIAIILTTGVLTIANSDYKVFFTVLLGIYLLACTYSAIGLFISSLTNYQVVAALMTIMAFFLLNFVQYLWQNYDFVRDLTYFLNLSGRTDFLMSGLITTRDILYFILISALFITFTFLKLKSRKESRPWYIHFSRYTGVLIVVLLLGYLTNRPANVGYLDVSRDQINTIHPAAQKALAKLGDETLHVTLYTNLFDPWYSNGLPRVRNTYLWQLWGKYLRFHPNMKFNYVYYYDLIEGDSTFYKQYPNKSIKQIADRIMKLNGLSASLFKNPDQIKDIIDLREEGKRLVMQLEYKGKKTFLRTYDDMEFWPNQSHFTAAFNRLTADSIPLVLFTTGHYERNPYKFGEREYSPHTLGKLSRTSLLNQGVDVDTINLEQNDIPASASILVIADPKTPLSPVEQEKIHHYMEDGRNTIFYGEPGKQEMLQPLLNPLGVQLEKGVLVAPNNHEMAHVTQNEASDFAGWLSEESILYSYQKGKILLPPLIIMGASVINYQTDSTVKVQDLFNHGGTFTPWIERGNFVADSAAPIYSVAEGDIKKDKYTTGIALSRKKNEKDQRIIVLGDADFMSAKRGSGSYMGNSFYSWLLYNQYPEYINYPHPSDNLITITKAESRILWLVFVYAIPAVVFLCGAVFLIRRKRK